MDETHLTLQKVTQVTGHPTHFQSCNQVLNLRLEFRHEKGIYKYDKSIINVWLMYDEIMT